MRKLLLTLPLLCAPQLAGAQSKTPSGFTIRISPTADTTKPEDISVEAVPAAGKKTVRKKARRSKASRKARKSRRRGRRGKRRAAKFRKAPQPTDTLVGTGASYARKTPWGVIETTNPRMAAIVRARSGGVVEEDDRHLVFRRGSVELSDETKAILGSISDLLEVRPEIGLLLVEGHAADGGQLADDQLLSEARASAVREFLVGRGVGSGRILAYGLGRLQGAGTPAGSQRRVVLRLVEPSKNATRPATEWSRAAAVQLSGVVQTMLPEEETPWRTLGQRDEIPEDGDLRTGEDGKLLIRLPDASTVLLEPSTELRLENLAYDFAKKSGELAILLRRGTIRLQSNASEGSRTQATITYAGGAVQTYGADLRLRVDDAGQGALSIDRGTAQVTLGDSRPMTLGHGQRLIFGQDAPIIRSRLADPTVSGPLTGSATAPVTFSWQTVPGAIAYRVEVARAIDFFDLTSSQTVTKNHFAAPELEIGQTYYWRVLALDEAGESGESSQIHAFTVAAPKPPED